MKRFLDESREDKQTYLSLMNWKDCRWLLKVHTGPRHMHWRRTRISPLANAIVVVEIVTRDIKVADVLDKSESQILLMAN
jgi:hypothetical protein